MSHNCAGITFGERHLRHMLLSYMNYYNATRTHLSLNKVRRYHARRDSRTHYSPPNPEWTAPPICQDLICDKDRGPRKPIRRIK